MLIGIVGKPNCGKSTFFKASTLMNVEIANYPFATIKPNQGVGFVRVECVCKEFEQTCNPREGFSVDGTRFVPVNIIDVAGLVPGAYEGKGMGNQFLDDLRQADCLIHVIDASGGTNEKGEPVEAGSYDPGEDIRFLDHELDMWYMGIFKRVWDKFSRTIRQEQADPAKAIAKQFSGLGVTEDLVKETFARLKLPQDLTAWSDENLKAVVTEFRKATKPMVIAANKVDTDTGKKNLKNLKERFPEHKIIGCSAESELALKEAAKHGLIGYIPGDKSFSEKGELTDAQNKGLEFISSMLKEQGETGVQKILDAAVFDVLGFIAIFPGGVNRLTDSDGNVLPDCFLMPANTTALDFAYRLHTDFGKNFIKALDVRTKKPVAKDQVLKHRDILEIKT
ncbi:MAG: redox-regulated ATPase YchF [Candidatus Woesearchaeota archaeon]